MQVFSSNGEAFTVYVRELKAGESVTLGSNFTNKDAVNYFAAAVKKEAEPTEPVTTATVTTTTETATTTRTENTSAPAVRMPGDADCSGTVDVSDAVLIARYSAEDREARITDQGLLNADCDGVKGVDGADVTAVLQYIARIITVFPA